MIWFLDVLLDMKAAGSELGWLTWPNEEGVSLITLYVIPDIKIHE